MKDRITLTLPPGDNHAGTVKTITAMPHLHPTMRVTLEPVAEGPAIVHSLACLGYGDRVDFLTRLSDAPRVVEVNVPGSHHTEDRNRGGGI